MQFKVIPAGLQEGRATIRAVLESEGEKYSEGYTLVTREDLGSFYYYQPARQRVSIVDVQVPHDLKVGYIMGAGDDIPTVLQQVGMNVTLIPAEKIASEDLSKYGTIVLGIRAYDTQKDVATNNKKLLDFVSAGGTLVVQYNAGGRRLQRGKVHALSRGIEPGAGFGGGGSGGNSGAGGFCVSFSQHDHGARFRWMGAGARAVLHGARGMNISRRCWRAMIRGKTAQKGGLLRAQYGKGTYIYTGYAFFRQLPAGVPGAVRLYVNLLSAGMRAVNSDQ